MKNITSLFGKKEANDYDKYYRDDDDLYNDTEEGDEDVTTYGEKRTDGVSFNASSAPVSLKVVKPKSYADGPSIADHLAAGSTVVLNIESLDRAGAIRLIDFLMGAIHVLGGDMKSVTKTTLVFAPRNVGVSDFENVEESADVEENDGEELDA
ncbi:MAG: cell division protein SepF [Clostridia bacterium]|nr:cell division protein SepF [Clostridia bacterium]MBR3845025.1 cell division protein SepF [Clostridia bacterium]